MSNELLFDKITESYLDVTSRDLGNYKTKIPHLSLDVLKYAEQSLVRDMIIDSALWLVFSQIYEVIVYCVLVKKFDEDMSVFEKEFSTASNNKEKKEVRKKMTARQKKFDQEYIEKSRELWSCIEFEYFLLTSNSI